MNSDFDTTSINNMDVFLTGFALVFFAIAIIVSIAYYILFAIAYQGVAKREGRSFWWVAWVPIVSSVALPLLAKDDVHPSVRGNNFVYLYIGAYFASLFLSLFIPILPALAFYVLFYYPFFIIAKSYSHNAVMHTVVAVITLSVSIPFSMLMFKNRIDGQDLNNKQTYY